MDWMLTELMWEYDNLYRRMIARSTLPRPAEPQAHVMQEAPHRASRLALARWQADRQRSRSTYPGAA